MALGLATRRSLVSRVEGGVGSGRSGDMGMDMLSVSSREGGREAGQQGRGVGSEKWFFKRRERSSVCMSLGWLR